MQWEAGAALQEHLTQVPHAPLIMPKSMSIKGGNSIGVLEVTSCPLSARPNSQALTKGAGVGGEVSGQREGGVTLYPEHRGPGRSLQSL